VLLGEVVEGEEVLGVALQAVGGVGLALGAKLLGVGGAPPGAFRPRGGLVDDVEPGAGLGMETPEQLVEDVQAPVVPTPLVTLRTSIATPGVSRLPRSCAMRSHWEISVPP